MSDQTNLERHANELELSNSRQAAEILRLQACCAEMRPLVQMLGWYGNGPDMDKFYHCPLCRAYGEDSDTLPHTPTCKIGHALSTDCGKGWMPPAEREKLQARNKRLVATCKRAAELYDHLAMSPLEAVAKYGPDYEPPSDAEWLEMRQMLAEALAAENKP